MRITIKNNTTNNISLPGPLPRLSSRQQITVNITPKELDIHRSHLNKLQEQNKINVLSVEGVYAEYKEDEGISGTTGIEYIQKVRLVLTSEKADYLIFYNAEVLADSNTTIKVRVQIDDTDTIAETNPPNINEDFSHIGGYKKVTLTAGIHNIDIDFVSTKITKNVSIRCARLAIIKVI